MLGCYSNNFVIEFFSFFPYCILEVMLVYESIEDRFIGEIICDKGILRPEIGSACRGFGVSVGVASQIELVNY